MIFLLNQFPFHSLMDLFFEVVLLVMVENITMGSTFTGESSNVSCNCLRVSGCQLGFGGLASDDLPFLCQDDDFILR